MLQKSSDYPKQRVASICVTDILQFSKMISQMSNPVHRSDSLGKFHCELSAELNLLQTLVLRAAVWGWTHEYAPFQRTTDRRERERERVAYQSERGMRR